MPRWQDAIEATGASYRLTPAKAPVRDLLAAGEVLEFRGGRYTEYSTPHLPTLDSLVAFAAGRVRQDLRVAPGRRTATDTTRQVMDLTPKQHERIRTVANKVTARCVAEVSSGLGWDELLAWDPMAEDWTAFLDLVKSTCGAGTRAQDVGTARLLLDLAATHGLLHHSPRHAQEAIPIPAEWAGVYNDWRAATSPKMSQARGGLMVLFEAIRATQHTPSSPDWAEVHRQVEHWRAVGRLTAEKAELARRAYRTLLGVGSVTGPQWDGRLLQHENGLSLVRISALRRMCEQYGCDAPSRDYSALQFIPWAGFGHVPGLVEGPFGLRTACLYLTVPHRIATLLGLPARGVYPTSAVRKASEKSSVPLRSASLRALLERVLVYAGWLARTRGVDFAKNRDGVLPLLAQENLEAMRNAVLVAGILSDDSWRRTVAGLARLASPFGEGVARQLATSEASAGHAADAEHWRQVADHALHVSRMLHSDGLVGGKRSWHTQLVLDERDNVVSRTRAKAHRVEQAWTAGRQGTAYEQLELVREELVRHFCSRHGGALAEQVDRVGAGWRPGLQWAKEVRDAMYWQDQLILPLRAATSVALDECDRTTNSGMLRIHVPASKFKVEKNGDLMAYYYKGTGSSYYPELARLYLMPGGARAILTAPGRERLITYDAFYVPDTSRTNATRMDSAALRRAVLRVVEAVGPDVGLDPKMLQQRGVLGTHFFRHALGTFLVRRGRIEVAAALLHHSSLDMLVKVYSASSAEAFDMGQLRAEDRTRENS